MTRRKKTTGEYCAEESAKACVTTCSQECSRGCSKAFIVTIIIHFKEILTSGVNFISFKEFIITEIRKYQRDISPKLKTQCLFEPSCSNYAIGAIQKYGVIKGIMKISVRIIKCSPLTKRLSFGQIVDLP